MAPHAHSANAFKAQARQKRLAEQHKSEEAKVNEFFEKYAHSSGAAFSRDEFKSVLTEVKREALGDPTAAVRDEMLDRIVSTYDLSHDGTVHRTEVLRAVKRYRALLKHDAWLQALFDKHNVDGSAALEQEELLHLLQDVALEAHVKNEPLPTRVKRARLVGQPDVDFVLDNCDRDGDRAISLDELGPAIAAWREAAATIVHEQHEPSASPRLVTRALHELSHHLPHHHHAPGQRKTPSHHVTSGPYEVALLVGGVWVAVQVTVLVSGQYTVEWSEGVPTDLALDSAAQQGRAEIAAGSCCMHRNLVHALPSRRGARLSAGLPSTPA